MMKLFPLFTGLLLLSSFANPESNVRNDSERQDFRGKVRYVRERTYHAVTEDGYVHRGGRYLGHYVDRDNEMWFDQDGNFASRKYYDQNDSLREIRYFRYDDKRNLLTDCTVYRNGEFADCIFYSYNIAGHMISKKNIYMYPGWENLFRNETTFQYNAEGHIVIENSVDSVNEQFCYVKYFTYNNRGLISKWTKKYADGETYNWICEYDDRGNLIREFEPQSIGHTAKEYHWFYGHPKFPEKVTSHIEYRDSRERYYYSYQYYDSGQLWKQEASSDTTRNLSSVIIYNEQGDRADESLYYNSELTKQHHYEYKYDEHGNWISLTWYVDGVARTITERTILYY